MKKTVLALVALTTTFAALAQGYVNPYIKNDGTVVQGHHRSAPDSNPYNNYSTQGNTNPYTGQAGTVSPHQQHQAYPSPQPIRQQQCGVTSSGQYVCR